MRRAVHRDLVSRSGDLGVRRATCWQRGDVALGMVHPLPGPIYLALRPRRGDYGRSASRILDVVGTRAAVSPSMGREHPLTACHEDFRGAFATIWTSRPSSTKNLTNRSRDNPDSRPRASAVLAPYFPDHRVAVDQMDSQKIDFAIRVDVDDLNLPPALVITGNHE
jgi:hypothetical protein